MRRGGYRPTPRCEPGLPACARPETSVARRLIERRALPAMARPPPLHSTAISRTAHGVPDVSFWGGPPISGYPKLEALLVFVYIGFVQRAPENCRWISC